MILKYNLKIIKEKRVSLINIKIHEENNPKFFKSLLSSFI